MMLRRTSLIRQVRKLQVSTLTSQSEITLLFSNGHLQNKDYLQVGQHVISMPVQIQRHPVIWPFQSLEVCAVRVSHSVLHSRLKPVFTQDDMARLS